MKLLSVEAKVSIKFTRRTRSTVAVVVGYKIDDDGSITVILCLFPKWSLDSRTKTSGKKQCFKHLFVEMFYKEL